MPRTQSNQDATETSSPREGTRERLMTAMIKVVGSEGLHAASVRTIAKAAGCNEAVLYQHFSSKVAMQQAIYEEIVTEMANEKRAIAKTAEDPETLIDRWVEATYRFYDLKPYAFAYVYMSYPPLQPTDASFVGLNSKIFKDAIQAMTPPQGHRIDLSPGNFAIYRAALLGPPREIHSGEISGNAIDYLADGARCVRDILIRPID